MTMRELAKLAGVSVSTVSKAFSGSREISIKQRDKIFCIAKENGCFRKYYKSSSAKPVIAVIGPEFKSPYYAQQLSFLEAEIQKRGGIMVTGSHNFDADVSAELFFYFTQHVKVDGVLMYTSYVPKERNDVPIVVIGKSDTYDSIALSWRNAIEDAVTHFLENGHSNIAFIGDIYTHSKKKVFVETMQKMELHLPEDYLVESPIRFEEAGYSVMNALLKLDVPPTAVLAAYDSIAIGVMKSVYEHGLNIPKDISLIGMDDIASNLYFETPLTSATSYNADFCEIAVDMLFDRMQNREAERKQIKVSATLIKRSSVGKI